MNKIILMLILSISFLYSNVGKITALKGDVSVLRNKKIINAALGFIVQKSDKVKTGENSRVQIVFKDNTIISLGKKSIFSIQEYIYEAKKPVKASFNFGKGVFKTITGKIGKINPKRFKLKTKTANIGIRGTIVGIESTNIGDKIIVPEGQIVVETLNGITNILEGQMTEVVNGEALEVKVIPPSILEKIEKDSGAQANEQESGQGEATQTKALTKKEKEEAKEQQGTEDNSEEQNAEEESSQEKNEDNQDSEENKEETTEEESQQNQEQSNEEENNDPQNSTTSEGNSPESSSENDAPIESDNLIEIETEEPEIEIDTDLVEGVLENVEDVLNEEGQDDIQDLVDEQTPDPVYYYGKHYSLLTDNSTVIKLDNDVLDMNIVNNTVSIDEVTTKNGTLNINSFSTVPESSYLTVSSIGTLGFTKTYTGYSDSTEYYNMYADNLREFFVGYTDTTLDFNGSSFDYTNLFFGGVRAKKSDIQDKVYIYKGLKTLEINTDDESNPTTVTKSLKLDEGNLYLNGATKSIHYLNKKELYEGATTYNAGYIFGSKASIQMKYFDIEYNDSTSFLDYAIGAGSGKMFGSQLQGIGVQLDADKIDSLGITQDVSLATFYLDKDKSTQDTLTGTYGDSNNNDQLFTSASYYDGGEKNSEDATTYIKVDRDTGSIDAQFDFELGVNDITVRFLGEIRDSDLEDGIDTNNTSYYINDDMFGAVVSSDDSFISGTPHIAIEDAGYFEAVPDKITFDVGGDVEELGSYDDSSSWGYWTASFDDGSIIGSTWVAGIQMATSTIDSLMTASPDALTFKGNVIGSVNVNGTVENILMNSDNAVTLNFNLGSGANTLNGLMKFKTASSSFDFNINSATITNTGYTTTDLTTNLTGDAVSGNIDGKFFGTGSSIDSTGGNVNVSSTKYTATTESAKFKATNTDITGN